MRELKRIILHCSATHDYEPDSSAFDLIGAKDIDVWHKHRGWNGIGYHYVVRRTGVIERGRPLLEIGAHAKGENTDTVGVCYVGTRRPTDAQLDSLLVLAKKFYTGYGLGAQAWHGHYEFSNKECPGLPINLFRKLVDEYID